MNLLDSSTMGNVGLMTFSFKSSGAFPRSFIFFHGGSTFAFCLRVVRLGDAIWTCIRWPFSATSFGPGHMSLMCDFVGEATSFPVPAIAGFMHETTPLRLLSGVGVLFLIFHVRFPMVCVDPNSM